MTTTTTTTLHTLTALDGAGLAVVDVQTVPGVGSLYVVEPGDLTTYKVVATASGASAWLSPDRRVTCQVVDGLLDVDSVGVLTNYDLQVLGYLAQLGAGVAAPEPAVWRRRRALMAREAAAV